MNESNKSRDVSPLIALANAMIEYWKEIARRNFVKAYPQAEPAEFERATAGIKPVHHKAVDCQQKVI